MAFLGGLGTIAGPVLGALIIEPGQLYLTIRFTNGYYGEILLGAIFLVVVLFVPRGIIPTGGEWIRRLRTRGRSALPSVGPASPGMQQASGPTPRGPAGPQRRPDAEDTPPEASEAPAREANR
jgi:branched-chain amino acid transport system permease protein